METKYSICTMESQSTVCQFDNRLSNEMNEVHGMNAWGLLSRIFKSSGERGVESPSRQKMATILLKSNHNLAQEKLYMGSTIDRTMQKLPSKLKTEVFIAYVVVTL